MTRAFRYRDTTGGDGVAPANKVRLSIVFLVAEGRLFDAIRRWSRIYHQLLLTDAPLV